MLFRPVQASALMDHPYRNILIPVSLRDTTDRLVEQGARVARAFHSTIWLLHVFKTSGFTSGHRLPPELKNEQDKEIQAIHRALDVQANKLQAQGLEVISYLLPGIDPADVILEQAEAVKADLVVMGLHGRSALVEALMGDVAHDVLRKAPCPVLVVPLTLTLPEKEKREATTKTRPEKQAD